MVEPGLYLFLGKDRSFCHNCLPTKGKPRPLPKQKRKTDIEVVSPSVIEKVAPAIKMVLEKKVKVIIPKISKQEIKKQAVAIKGGKCCRCGYNKCINALEFHHIDPAKKTVSISKLTRLDNEAIQELDKCILVCSNCHREIHYLDNPTHQD